MKRGDVAASARREIVSATIGVLIGLAFSMMADTIKDPVKAYFSKHEVSVTDLYPLFWTDTFWLATMFLLTTFSFFVGTQTYLRSREESHSGWWFWDFFCTIITLSALAGLGILVRAPRPFLQGLGLFYGFQVLWALPHIRSQALPRWWAGLDACTCVLTLYCANKPQLSYGILLGVFVVHAARFLAEVILVPRFGAYSTS